MNNNKLKSIKIFIAIVVLYLPLQLSASTVSKSQSVKNVNLSCTSGINCKLLAYWTFDGSDIVNGVIRDVSATTTPANGNTISIATSTFYVPGKIGQALNFDGVDDAINIGLVPGLHASTSDLTISAWIKPNKVTVGVLCIICNSNSGGGIVPWSLEFNSTAGRFSLGQVGAGSGTVRVLNSTTLKKDVWYHVVAVRTFVNTLNWPTTMYLNGVADGSGTIQRAGYANQIIAIGKYGQINNNYFQGAIDDIRIYNRALSANEIRQLYNSGVSKFASSKTIISTTTCVDSLSCGLVQYWTFNGKDVINGVVQDSSGGGNRGTISGISSTTFYTSGKIGQAFNFDGVNDTVFNLGPTPNLTSTNTTTISFWANKRSFDSSGGLFFESSTNYNNNDGAVMFDPNSSACSGEMLLSIQDSVATGKYRSECFSRPSSNTWNNYTVIYDNSTVAGDIRLFINGIEQSSQSIPTNTKDQASGLGNYTWYLMSRAGSSLFNSGLMDEFYVYNRALSNSEILKLYNAGMTKYATSPTVTNISSCSSGLNCGLVGYWTFDGKDTMNGFIRDSSTSLKNGNVFNISTTTFYTPGELGQAVNFDGVDDYVDTGNVSSSVKTMSFWIRPNNINRSIINTNSSSGKVDISSGSISTTGYTSPTVYVNSSVSSSVINGKWQHVVITSNTAFNADSVNIGRSGSSYFSGAIDDVRFYNRVLSASEIRHLYSMGK